MQVTPARSRCSRLLFRRRVPESCDSSVRRNRERERRSHPRARLLLTSRAWKAARRVRAKRDASAYSHARRRRDSLKIHARIFCVASRLASPRLARSLASHAFTDYRFHTQPDARNEDFSATRRIRQRRYTRMYVPVPMYVCAPDRRNDVYTVLSRARVAASFR